MCRITFFNKVTGFRPSILSKKNNRYRCFALNFTKFFRTAFFTDHLQKLAPKLHDGEFTENITWSIINVEYQCKALQEHVKIRTQGKQMHSQKTEYESELSNKGTKLSALQLLMFTFASSPARHFCIPIDQFPASSGYFW